MVSRRLMQLKKNPVHPSGLHRMPRVKPSEICSLSLCERVTVLELKLAETQARVQNCVACDKLSVMEDRLNAAEVKLDHLKVPSYATVVTESNANHPPVRQGPKAGSSQSTATEKNASGQKEYGLTVNLPPIKPTVQIKSPADAPQSAPDIALTGSQLSIVSAASNYSKPSHFEDGFEYQSAQKQHMRRKFNSDAKKRKTVSGNGNSNKLRGAPLPSRDLFVYRVEKGTDPSDLADYMKDNGIVARSIQKVSNAEAKFDSFRVELKVTDVNDVMDTEFWPVGICVRRFNQRKTENDYD